MCLPARRGEAPPEAPKGAAGQQRVIQPVRRLVMPLTPLGGDDDDHEHAVENPPPSRAPPTAKAVPESPLARRPSRNVPVRSPTLDAEDESAAAAATYSDCTDCMAV
eukprot:13254-Prymnesium_polylepis.1